MKTDEQIDPVARVLSQLGTPQSSSARDRQVREKCHAAMARHSAARLLERKRRPPLTRILDVAFAAAASLYGAASLAEAIRLVALR
jgi:hypothetical protein